MSMYVKFDYLYSDPHYKHKRLVSELGDGSRKQFSSVEEHDEELIRRWNATVSSDSLVLCTGDFAFSPMTTLAEVCPRLNGRKVLLKGNHDTAPLEIYTPYFEDIISYSSLALGDEKKAIISHIPVHPSQLMYRYVANIHGHTHQYLVDDPRYINICVEYTNLAPISRDEVKSRALDGIRRYKDLKSV